MIVDACCPDPACTCTEVVLGFFSVDGESTEVEGELGERRPTKASALGKALWNAVHDEPELLDRLVERRDDVRHWGPFIVGAAYEKVRLARRASAPAEDEGGYLQGGAIPEALVRRLFDAAERLHAARSAIEAAWWASFRVEVRGAIPRDAWAAVMPDPTTVALFDTPEDDVPWLDLMLAPRDEATLEMRRQRCALGLPLLGGASLPIVQRARPDGKFGPPSADDVRLAVAVVEALLAAPREEIVGVSTAPRVFEHRVELDAGSLDVRLTASHAEHPWTEEAVEGGGDPDLLDEGDDLDDFDDLDDEDEEDDTFALSADPLVEAFTDAALDRGLAREVVITARVLLDAIAGFASEEGMGFFDERTWAAFLSDYAPRKVMLDEGDIARAPAALRAVADWLGEVGHVEPRRFRASLDRALPSFQQRARDPRRFSSAKALFTEMRAAGVDLDDQAAIDRFLAVKNAMAARPLPASVVTAATAAATPSKASVTRSPTRWSPAPGERWPAPTDPCGCGSGRRFKKCCMPR